MRCPLSIVLWQKIKVNFHAKQTPHILPLCLEWVVSNRKTGALVNGNFQQVTQRDGFVHYFEKEMSPKSKCISRKSSLMPCLKTKFNCFALEHSEFKTKHLKMS